MHKAAGVVLCLALLLPAAPASAEAMWGVSPGIKLSWTFGYGLTWGIEVSIIRLPDLDVSGSLLEASASALGQFITETYGIVINIDTDFSDTFKARVGGEWVGPFIGLEVGPSLIIDREGTHFGLGFTPWAGYYLFGHYTFTLLFDNSPNHHELGLYLKSPLLGSCDGDCHDDFD
jgi:hypothetical protein